MIFEHEDGNWKNSEIARTMMQILASSSEPSDAPVAEVEVFEEVDDALSAEAHSELRTFYRAGASHLIINELNKVAELVSNDSRASLEIEMAIEDIKEIFK
jgi:hypothetical protein